MRKVLILDTSVLGQIAHPRPNADLLAWIVAALRTGAVIAYSEVTDYELRRSFLQADLTKSLSRLDACATLYTYLPLSTDVMRRAAVVWAQARRMGRPLADVTRLDGDAILLGQALLLQDDGDQVRIITDNVKHLGLFADAQRWPELDPADPFGPAPT
ncbi:MAG TPA: hypothetical protein VGE07_05915 [Herpetosiphonaceae bacterium]